MTNKHPNDPWWVKQIRRFYFLSATVSAASILLSYYVGYWFSLLYHYSLPEIGGLWSAISAGLVFSSLNEGAAAALWLRIAGSFVGVLLAMSFVYLFGYTIYAFACGLFLSVVACQVLGIRSAFRTALITVVVLVIVGRLSHEPPWLEALSRFAETAIGGVITYLFVLCFYPMRKRYDLFWM